VRWTRSSSSCAAVIRGCTRLPYAKLFNRHSALREEARQQPKPARSQPILGRGRSGEGNLPLLLPKDYNTAVLTLRSTSAPAKITAGFLNRWPILSGARSVGPKRVVFQRAERLDPGKLTYSPARDFLISSFVAFPKRCESWIRFSILQPDDVDTLWQGGYAQAEGACRGPSALLVPLHPAADDTNVLEAQVTKHLGAPPW